jgi:hypothetical protein
MIHLHPPAPRQSSAPRRHVGLSYRVSVGPLSLHDPPRLGNPYWLCCGLLWPPSSSSPFIHGQSTLVGWASIPLILHNLYYGPDFPNHCPASGQVGLIKLNPRLSIRLHGLWGGSAAARQPCSCLMQTYVLTLHQGPAAGSSSGGGASGSGSGGGARAGARFALDIPLPGLLAAAAAASPGPGPAVTDLQLSVAQPGPEAAAGAAAGLANQPPAAPGTAATELLLDVGDFPLLERLSLSGCRVGPVQEPRVGASGSERTSEYGDRGIPAGALEGVRLGRFQALTRGPCSPPTLQHSHLWTGCGVVGAHCAARAHSAL